MGALTRTSLPSLPIPVPMPMVNEASPAVPSGLS
jgi:hypothetical protein